MTAQITALPTPPSTNDPANFNTRADAFLGQMPTFVTEANALAGEVNANTQAAAASATAAANKVVEATGKAAEAAASAASALNAPGTNGTSTTSLTIGSGTKAFTTQTGKAWVAGQGFFLASTASPLNWMTGILTAYNPGTGAATVEVDSTGGLGTFSVWNCGLAAGRPLPVATQAQAETGTDTASWMTPQRTAQAALALAMPVGSVMQSAANPGSRWVLCNGQLYATATYPALATMMTPYTNPMALRQSVSDTGQMVYGGGLFLVWANNGTAWFPYTSPDGVTWTQRTNPFGSGGSPNILVYGAGLFVAHNGGLIFTSSDGLNWTSRTNPATSLYCLARGSTNWIGMAQKNGNPVIVTSNDGLTWTLQTTNIPDTFLSAIAYSPALSRWVAATSNAVWVSNDNGSTWVSLGSGPSYGANAMVWGNGRFVIAAANYLYYSTDGVSGFIQASAGIFSGQAILGLWYDGAQFYASSTGGSLGRSSDGVTWTSLVAGVGTATISGVARASSSVNSPTVIAASASGLRSGLDISTTQFIAPTISGAASGISAYIKGQ